MNTPHTIAGLGLAMCSAATDTVAPRSRPSPCASSSPLVCTSATAADWEEMDDDHPEPC